jgi:diguanylate cyclase (GGDEF)-like protein
LGPVILSVVLVCAMGAVGLGLTAHADTKGQDLLVQDRTTMQATLGSLGKEYVLFSLKEGLDYASTGSWALTPDNPNDQARLRAFVTNATFLNYGASLVTTTGTTLDSYATGAGLPPSSDPGYAPMIRSLLARQPDLSSVMEVGGTHVVAVGVPVEVGGHVEAIFVGYMNLERSPLESYVEQLHYGKTGHGYVIDSTGTVVAGPSPSSIGTRLAVPRALAAVARGRSGAYEDSRTGREVAFSPFGVGGWSGVTEQNGAEFFGPIRSSDLRVGVALLALLALAAALIIVLGYRQEASRRRFQELLAHQAYHDGLTGLANRSLLHNRLAEAMSRARRQQRGVALLYLDLDGFKPVNDRAGHEAGDELLVTVADRLRASVRVEDTVARVGGDEFAILMEDLDDPESARQAAERLVETVGQPVSVRGREVAVGVSVGIAFSQGGEDDGDSLMRDADLAMYRAKDAGKNSYVCAGDPVPARGRTPVPAAHL